ncbi:MAG: hypothetical protein ACR2QA_19155 [Solirubrobacteraceae bacterium]
MELDLYFTDYFEVGPEVLADYGAFDISVVSDLPLFIDPFLLFNSEKPDYQQLHQQILEYLIFLRDRAVESELDPKLIDVWYRFKEVKQNWLGFTLFGNDGAGLGTDFAEALYANLGVLFSDFGKETVTQGTHLEKLCLIRGGVGRDNISDFTTNLIKGYLCDYTQTFAREHIDTERCKTFRVPRIRFNYETQSWATETYYLPELRGDFVLLTPEDMLTRDETWINHHDMVRKFAQLPAAMPDAETRATINNYFIQKLGEKPTVKERRQAAAETIQHFPQLIDQYIKLQEDSGDQAEAVSAERVENARRALIDLTRTLVAGLDDAGFYDKPWSSYEECLARAHFFKSWVENNDGYRLFNPSGSRFAKESDVQLAFALAWCSTDFDVNREVNNGRGPVDFKVSYGAGDKSLIEFKLAKNTGLKRNLEKQVEIYEKANRTWTSVKVIMFYTAEEQERAKNILKELGLLGAESIVLIDARNDNKPSASKA